MNNMLTNLLGKGAPQGPPPPYSGGVNTPQRGVGTPSDGTPPGNLSGRDVKIQKAGEVEDKARGVFSRMCSSALFWTCFSAAILLIATIVVLTGCLGLAGLAFIPAIGLGAIPAGIYAYTHSDEIVSEGRMMGSLFTQFKGDEWFHDINDSITIGGLPLKNKGHLKELAEKDISHVISVVDKRVMEFVGILHEPISKKDYEEVGIDHTLYSSKQGDALHTALIASIVDKMEDIFKQDSKARILIHGGADSSKARIIAACYLIHKYSLEQDNKHELKNWTKDAYKEVLKGEPLGNVAHEELEMVQNYHKHLVEDKGLHVAGMGMMGSLYIGREGDKDKDKK